MGSLPDSKYIIKTDGYWFVEAHDVDPSKGYITVSAKGIVNGLSNQPNDGADFGPDSYNPNYSGSGIPYTQTSGIAEAWKLSAYNGQYYAGESGVANAGYMTVPIHLSAGIFKITGTSTLDAPGVILQPKIIGAGQATTWIELDYNGGYAFTFTPDMFYGSNINLFSHCTSLNGVGYTPTGFMYIDIPSTQVGYQSSVFNTYSFNVSGGTLDQETIHLGGLLNVILIDPQFYSQTTFSVHNSQAVEIVAGALGGNINGSMNFYSVDHLGIAHMKEGNQSIYLDNVTDVLLLDSAFEYIVATGTIESMYWLNTNKLGSAGSYRIQIPSGKSAPTINKFIVNNDLNYAGVSFPYYQSGVTFGYVMLSNIDSKYTALPSNSPTTPSVPTSGTPQSNTNPYPVNVYLYGGTVTVIDYTPSGGSATQVGTLGPATVRLNPGDSITLTYSAAPTWNWVAV